MSDIRKMGAERVVKVADIEQLMAACRLEAQRYKKAALETLFNLKERGGAPPTGGECLINEAVTRWRVAKENYAFMLEIYGAYYEPK